MKAGGNGIIRGYHAAVCRQDEQIVFIDITTKPYAFEEILHYVSTQAPFVRQIYCTSKAYHIHMIAVSNEIKGISHMIRGIQKDCFEGIVSLEFCAVTETIKDEEALI